VVAKRFLIQRAAGPIAFLPCGSFFFRVYVGFFRPLKRSSDFSVALSKEEEFHYAQHV
jgi:hypothetical protein